MKLFKISKDDEKILSDMSETAQGYQIIESNGEFYMILNATIAYNYKPGYSFIPNEEQMKCLTGDPDSFEINNLEEISLPSMRLARLDNNGIPF